MSGVQVLISCVSAEFLEYRDIIRRELRRPKLVVLVQEEFVTTGTSTLEKLEDNVLACDALIHVVGDMAGAYADARSVEYVRGRHPDLLDRFPDLAPLFEADSQGMSYTQWEAWLALYHRKPVFIAVPRSQAPRGANPIVSDVERASQAAHLKRLEGAGCYIAIRFADAVDLANLALKSSLRELEIAVAARDGQSDYEVVAPFAFGDRAPGSLPLIPGVLSKVIDREEQSKTMREMLRREHVGNQHASKPFVFLVSGSSLDGQEGLIHLYQHDILPEFLGKSPAARRMQYSPVVWPPSGYEVHDLKRDLANAVLLTHGATDADLTVRLVSGQGAQSLAYFIESRYWTAKDEQLLLNWIDYWTVFPVLPRGKIVSVFVCMQYSTSVWQWFERLRIGRFFDAVRDRFKDQPQIVCLSRLKPIEREDVIKWANFVVPSKSGGTRFDPSILKSEGIKPFTSGQRHIHFDVLEPVLRSALAAAHLPTEGGRRSWT
jgi:hypothetical protein